MRNSGFCLFATATYAVLGEGRAEHRDEILSEGCSRTIRQPSNAVLAAGDDRHPFAVQGTDFSEIHLIFKSTCR